VTDVNDPAQLGRVKVRCPNVGGQKDLAWARCAIPVGGDESGGFWVPPQDARVHVMFEAEDVNRPVIVGAAHRSLSETSKAPLAALGEPDSVRTGRGNDQASGVDGVQLREPTDPYATEYPKNHVFKTPGGHLIEADDTEGAERISITHGTKKTWIEMHPDGSLVVGVRGGKRYLLVEGDNQEHVLGNHDAVTTGNASYMSTGKFSRKALHYKLRTQLAFMLNVLSGPIDLKGLALNVQVPTTINLQAAGLTSIGPGADPGFVVTTKTHNLDYITGLPIVGTPLVVAG